MARKVILCTVQFGDLPLDTLCSKAKEFGYDGLELACNDNHVNLDKLSPE
jgi:sugar phosphate isomerase/epimerase